MSDLSENSTGQTTPMTSSDEVQSYIVVTQGRGVLFTCIVKGTHNGVAEACQKYVKQGMEVHIYTLKPSTKGFTLTPIEGATELQEVWHLFDATDTYEDYTGMIVRSLDDHTVKASQDYLQQVINNLQAEQRRLTTEGYLQPFEQVKE